MKPYIVSILFLFLCVPVFAIDFYGKVVSSTSSNDASLSDVTIIIIELDAIEVSDTEGNFVFKDIDAGIYTVKIITIEEKEFDYTIEIGTVSSSERDPYLFVLDDISEEFEQEIIVTAERKIQIEPNKEEYDAEFIDNLPVVDNDPFNIITTEAGVFINEKENATSPFLIDPQNGTFFSYGSLFSVFGGDSAWNQAYIDFLPIPSNTHLSDNTKPILSKESISSVKTLKGPPPGRYGQSLGGTTVVYPETVTSHQLDIGVGITDPFLSYRTNLNEHTTLFTMAKQSISQYTLFPLIQLIAESAGETQTNIERYLYGDLFLSLEYTKGADRIKLLTLAYYDTIDVSASNEDVTLESKNFPYFVGGGLQWSKLIGASAFNELDIYSYYYVANVNSEFRRKNIGETRRNIIELDQELYNTGYYYKGNSNVWNTGIKNIYSQSFFDNVVMSIGSIVDYVTLRSNYEDIFYYIDPNDSENKTDKEAALPKYTINEDYLKAYAFFQYDYEELYDRGEMSFSVSPGISWIAQDPSKVYPSVRADYALTFSDIHVLSLFTGWSPAFLEELQYVNRKILEKTIKYQYDETTFTNPSYGTMSFAKYLIQLGDHQLSVSPYFGWYYGFEGIFSQYKYNVVPDFSDPDYANSNIRGFSYLPVKHGFGTGATFRYQYTTDFHILDISYTLGFVYFKTKDDIWLPASNDYRHTIKLSYLYKVNPAFNFSLTNVYTIDTPFTPTVYEKHPSPEFPLTVYPRTGFDTTEINSARSYAPIWSLVPAFSGKFLDNKNVVLGYRFSLGDFLAWFQIDDKEIKDKETAGSSNKDPSNRKIEYTFSPSKWLRQLEISFFLTIKL